ncbi:hypothetical protein EJB05_10160, partial [Eragrostis curvula]
WLTLQISQSTFLHLKYLSITLYGAAFSRAYDCFSVVSFLDGAPLLETFVLGDSSSGIATTDAASLDCWRSITSEADGRTPAQAPEECEDHCT